MSVLFAFLLGFLAAMILAVWRPEYFNSLTTAFMVVITAIIGGWEWLTGLFG